MAGKWHTQKRIHFPKSSFQLQHAKVGWRALLNIIIATEIGSMYRYHAEEKDMRCFFIFLIKMTGWKASIHICRATYTKRFERISARALADKSHKESSIFEYSANVEFHQKVMATHSLSI